PGLAPGLDRGSIHVCRTSPELRREAAVDTCAGDDTPLEKEECLVAGLLLVGGAFLNEGGRCRADLAAASGRCSIAGSEISRNDMDSSSISSREPTAPAGTPPVGVVEPKIKGGTIGCCLRVGGRRGPRGSLRVEDARRIHNGHHGPLGRPVVKRASLVGRRRRHLCVHGAQPPPRTRFPLPSPATVG
ncbi:MAG: hypothetical protein ACPIOQ_75085, partial [Promethearchaeia archaeon]